MRVVKGICFVVLLSSFLAAQSSPPADSDSAKIQKLLDAMAAQQKAIADQQQQISQQQQEIEKLKQQLNTQPEAVSSSSDSQVARTVNASLTIANPSIANPNPVARTVSDMAQDQPKESPLSIRIGGAEFTPGGFMDFTGIFRSTNEGTLGTNFFNIPFSNAAAAHLTETRFTAQNSRLSLKATSKILGNDVTGYVEMDFLGNDGTNIEVTSNSHTLRQRLYFVNVRRNKFEIAAGQMWSWMTPNRAGLSSMPSDIFYSLNMDFNYQVGLTWARQPGVRFIYHPNEEWSLGVSLENPEQFGGQGEVTFPSAFNTGTSNLNNQIDSAAGGTAIPNLHPDIIPKIAYDTNMGGKHFHVEAAGLLSGFKVTNQVLPVPAAGEPFVKHTKEGVGLEGAVNLEVVKNFRFVANGFWSDGGGRYIFGLGPDLVVLPNAAGTDIELVPVHSYSGIFGFEAQVTPKTLFYGYYGGVYFQRTFAVDTTAKAPQPFVGFGGPGSASSNNRDIQEPSLGWIQTFWKSPQYGALQLITQASYLTRSPWVPVTTGPATAPSVFKNAHLAMGWVDLRYVLP